MFRGGVLALVLVLGCGKPMDDCQRAIARLARILQQKGHALSQAAHDRMVEVCRTGKFAAYDPVLRCAMDSSTDGLASECIDRGVKDVLTLSPGGSGEDLGLNPLLQNWQE